MIQDIQPEFLNNHYEKKQINETSRIFVFQGRNIYVNDEAEEIHFVTYGKWKQYFENEKKEVPSCTYLFSITEGSQETDYFLAMLSEEETDALHMEGYDFIRMFDLRSRKPKSLVYAGATAWHLQVWYRANRFCGACGQPMEHDEKERMMRCPHCGNMVFPKVAPAVIVGVTNGDKILMTKYADREYTRYALIAGFTEIGETAEQTVSREVMEEVGLKVKNITYYKSQPWGFDSNLLMGFYCELDDDSEITLDREELSVAEWVDYHDVKEDFEKLSLTREMMETFKQRKLEENEG